MSILQHWNTINSQLFKFRQKRSSIFPHWECYLEHKNPNNYHLLKAKCYIHTLYFSPVLSMSLEDKDFNTHKWENVKVEGKVTGASLVAQRERISLRWRRHRRRRFYPQVRKIPWRRKWQLAPVILSAKLYGQRSLAGYSPGVPKSRTRLRDGRRYSKWLNSCFVQVTVRLLALSWPLHTYGHLT